MTSLKKNDFQAHPFHLVSPSPWPLNTCISLLSLTCTGVLTMHNFVNAKYFLLLAFICVISSMSLWFRDIISEGRAQSLFFRIILSNYTINTAQAITQEEIKQTLINFYKKNPSVREIYRKNNQFAYYLTGLLEGDGHISLPALGNTTLNRVLNPRIIFTSDKKNLALYAHIQSELGGIGRFQSSGANTIRYIIGYIKGICIIIKLIIGKFRTPKNKRFNDLINFINTKYSLKIPESLLDKSDLRDSSWFTGFTEADGHFGVKVVESRPKSDTRKRSVSDNINLRFRLDQRLFDIPNCSSMLPIMEKLAAFLSCVVKTYVIKTKSGSSEILSASVSSIVKLESIVYYFNKYPLLGVKGIDFKYWEVVYHMILSKQHLTEAGRIKIKLIALKLKSNKE